MKAATEEGVRRGVTGCDGGREGGGGCNMQKKKEHKGQSVDSSSSYNSLTFSMST